MNNKQQNHEKGSVHEGVALEYLKARGCHVLEINFRAKMGEIDLIVKDGEYLVFVEVKYRKDERMGAPYEAVGFAKQRQICKTSDYYRMINGIGEFTPIRYDVISICGKQIDWIKNAFEYRYH